MPFWRIKLTLLVLLIIFAHLYKPNLPCEYALNIITRCPTFWCIMGSNWQTNSIIQAGNRRNNGFTIFSKRTSLSQNGSDLHLLFVISFISNPTVTFLSFVVNAVTIIREHYWVHFYYIVTNKGIISCTIIGLFKLYKSMNKYLSTMEAVAYAAFCSLKKNISFSQTRKYVS